MTRAATLFLRSLTHHLEKPYGGNLVPGNSADALAREFSGGLRAMLAALETEAAAVNSMLVFPGLHNLLMEVWTQRGDDQHLMNATGHERQWWLDAPIWASGS